MTTNAPKPGSWLPAQPVAEIVVIHPKPGSWLLKEMQSAARDFDALPDWARPVITAPNSLVSGKRQNQTVISTEWAIQKRSIIGGPFDDVEITNRVTKAPWTEVEARTEVALLTGPTGLYAPDAARVVSRKVTSWKP